MFVRSDSSSSPRLRRNPSEAPAPNLKQLFPLAATPVEIQYRALSITRVAHATFTDKIPLAKLAVIFGIGSATRRHVECRKDGCTFPNQRVNAGS